MDNTSNMQNASPIQGPVGQTPAPQMGQAPIAPINTNLPQVPMDNGIPTGQWVPVNPNEVGIQLKAGETVTTADGTVLTAAPSMPQQAPIMSNAQTAIPTPSSIVQMPPIVQPIALVPFTSQNQPLLQYDPYSRPEEPVRAPKAPEYVLRPYRGINIAVMAISFFALVFAILVSFGTFSATAWRSSTYGITGVISVESILAAVGISVGINGDWYGSDKIKSGDMLSLIFAYALPILIILFVIVTIILFIAAIAGYKKTEFDSLKILAAIDLVIVVLAIVCLLIMSNFECDTAYRGQNVGNFFAMKSSISMGIGAYLLLIFSIANVIVPCCAKKNAYVVKGDDLTLKSHIINN